MYTVLCVDDTPANLLVLESLFEDYNTEYKIITVQGGYEALEVLLKVSVDLILLDVMMPEIDGFQTAQLIKTNKLTKNIPIIFLTAKRDDQTIEKAFEYGVDYLSKPYDERELMARVESQIKLVDVQKKLNQQILFNQSVLDSQKNIMMIHGDDGVISANKSFLEFFSVNTVEEFSKNINCISELFMEYDNYFSLHILNGNKVWVDAISNSKENEYNVLIMDTNTFEPRAFKIDVSSIDNTDKFVISLTDITAITTKSRRFENKATYDALTNIYNRSKFNEELEEHYNLFKRYKHPLCFAIFDIDFFKQVNDTYGHVVGDDTLITFSKTIDEAVRSTDIFARWGGEEFTLLMPDTNIEDGFKVVEHLRELIENVTFKIVGQKTCSIGITQFKESDTIDSVLVRSDEALYEAKESGRNKVCLR